MTTVHDRPPTPVNQSEPLITAEPTPASALPSAEKTEPFSWRCRLHSAQLVQKRHERVISNPFLVKVVSNDQDALVLAVRPPDCIISWSAIASKADPLRLHPGGNLGVSLVIFIDRQSAKEIAKLGGMLSQEVRCRGTRRHSVKAIAIKLMA